MAVLVYLFWKKRTTWKSALIIFLFAILINVPQIINETKSIIKTVTNPVSVEK